MIDSPNAIRARADGASLIQVELGLGKNAIILLWLSAIVSAAAVVALIFTMHSLDSLAAKYEVLQYDHQALKAQLVAKGIYEGTEH